MIGIAEDIFEIFGEAQSLGQTDWHRDGLSPRGGAERRKGLVAVWVNGEWSDADRATSRFLMKHRARKSDEQKAAEKLEYNRRWSKDKRANDPEWRERTLARERASHSTESARKWRREYRKRPEVMAARAARKRARYAEDAAYREKFKADRREYHQRKKAA